MGTLPKGLTVEDHSACKRTSRHRPAARLWPEARPGI